MVFIVNDYRLMVAKEVHIKNGLIPVGAIIVVDKINPSNSKYFCSITPFTIDGDRTTLECELTEDFINSIGIPIPKLK